MIALIVCLLYFMTGLVSARCYYRWRAAHGLINDKCRTHRNNSCRRELGYGGGLHGCMKTSGREWTELVSTACALGFWPVLITLWSIKLIFKGGVWFVSSNPPTPKVSDQQKIKELEKDVFND
jgi:hypothetical protein